MEYVFTEETTGGMYVGDAYVRFIYQRGTVTARDEQETVVLEWLRSRGMCTYPAPVEE